jgi:hypothetical protein
MQAVATLVLWGGTVVLLGVCLPAGQASGPAVPADRTEVHQPV